MYGMLREVVEYDIRSISKKGWIGFLLDLGKATHRRPWEWTKMEMEKRMYKGYLLTSTKRALSLLQQRLR